jgi:hypothetical protein
MLGLFENTKHRNLVQAQNNALMQLVRGYWQALRVNGAPPHRNLLSPRGMSDALEHVFLIEQIAPGHARFRLSGMHLNELMGMELRGMPLGALITPDDRARFASILETSFAQKQIIEFRLEAERGFGKPELSSHLALYPLSVDPGEMPMAIGCLVSCGDIGHKPRRFAISTVMTESVTPQVAQAAAVEPPPAMAQPIFKRENGRPSLRLVHSRD